jgi:V/A-type H+/Na+-transporting ATPase subunit I
MRVNVQKFLFLGPATKKKQFFEKAQELGVIEFIDHHKKPVQDVPSFVQNLILCQKILKAYPSIEQEELIGIEGTDDVAKEVIALKDRLEKLQEEKRMIRLELTRVEPYGDFSLEEIKEIETSSKRFVQFFVTDRKEKLEAPSLAHMFHIARSQGLDYFMSLAYKLEAYDGMTEIKIEKTLSELKDRVEKIEIELKEIDFQLHQLTKFQNAIHSSLLDKLDLYNLFNSQRFVEYELAEKVFVIEGWIPKTDQKQALSLAEEFDVHCEQIIIENKDKIPTHLKNKGLSRIGQDLVNIYDPPSNKDKDPSLWVLIAFSLFFAMIIGDGGYGLLFLAGSLFLKFKNPLAKGSKKRFITLAIILSSSCLLWGGITGQFFGVKLDLDHPLKQCSILQSLVEVKADHHLHCHDKVFDEWVEKYPNLKDSLSGRLMIRDAFNKKGDVVTYTLADKFSDSIMMELAIVIGIIHISLSILRMIREHWAGLGWLLFIIGGYLYFPIFLKATAIGHVLLGISEQSAEFYGKYMLCGGVGLAVFLALIQHRLSGLGEIVNIIQIFSDVLSYLRLYALGLAGGMVSATFNDMGASIMPVGILVIILGHIVNIALSIMGGVIHGLRLNFLEWYHYSFEGGGRLLRPLALLSRD